MFDVIQTIKPFISSKDMIKMIVMFNIMIIKDNVLRIKRYI